MATHAHLLAPLIRKLSQRSPLGAPETEALLGLPFRVRMVERGTYLVRDGDKADHCTLLLSGFAYRSKIAGNGARQILSVHLRGDLLDLQNSLLERSDHNVQALTRVDVASIPHRALLDVAGKYQKVALALWRDTLIDASIFREWILNVGQRNARQRIAHLFCELALRQEAAGLCDGPSYMWPMTQEQIGDATGLTSVHVNRTLQGMRRDGLIHTGNQSVVIADWRGLQAAGDFSSRYLHGDAALAA